MNLNRPTNQNKGQKILVIDDDAQFRKIALKYLKSAGYAQILLAESGEEGLMLVKNEKPDLVITDTILPLMDGFEVCKRVRQLKGITPKIIIATGYDSAVDFEKARKAGADAFTVKAYDFSVLMDSIEDILK